MWELWGVEISAFPLTWHIAYTTACCYRTSRDKSSRFYFSDYLNYSIKFKYLLTEMCNLMDRYHCYFLLKLMI